MNDDQHFESSSAERSHPPASSRARAADERPVPPNRFLARLRFFRAMLWVLMYACAGIFLMSVIILDGLRLQSKIIGGALIVILALIAATYGLQWYS